MDTNRRPDLDLSLKRAATPVNAAPTAAIEQSDPDVELPPVTSGLADKAQQQAVTSSYLTSELEDTDVLQAVRPQVRQLLTAIPSYGQLPPEERIMLADDMVKVLSYLSDPDGVVNELATKGIQLPLASTQEDDPVETAKHSIAKSPGIRGQNFKTTVRENAEQLDALVQNVDFPNFVDGLIKNVFQAIVDSSIEQMRAYGELIGKVANTVDKFMTDSISSGAGRDWLAGRYPDVLAVEFNSGCGDLDKGNPAPSAKLTVRGDNPEHRLKEISQDLSLNPPVTDISDADAEQRLVTAARLNMAKARQQLLASMVMLGINRIVVTDGSINAKVIFDVRAFDPTARKYKASMHDTQEQCSRETMNANFGDRHSPFSASAAATAEQSHVATVESAVDETSKSKAEVTATLSGEVPVNITSD